MKRIVLPASLSSDLDWSVAMKAVEQPELIEFDFGWGKAPFFVNDPAVFQSYVLALDQFSKEVWPRIKEYAPGVVLYRGSVSVFSSIVIAEGDLTAVEAATVFASYLHRLVSFLPDEVIAYALFEDPAGFTKGEIAQLLSQDRFAYVHLCLTPSQAPLAVLLPPDELCSLEVLHLLSRLLEEEPSARVIPEKRLNELWHGLDELIVLDPALTNHGRRQLLGFEAAGGKIRSRGI